MTIPHDMTNQSAASETSYYGAQPSRSFDCDEGTIRVNSETFYDKSASPSD